MLKRFIGIYIDVTGGYLKQGLNILSLQTLGVKMQFEKHKKAVQTLSEIDKNPENHLIH